MARYIDAEKADVESISCFYGSECRIEDVQEWLDEQPTVDVVEVKRGKWEKRTFIVFDNEIKDSYHCSECNTTWDTATNYCPNCGAKMDGGKKE